MIDLTLILFALTVTLLLHLVEEVVTGFRTRLPVGEMPLGLFVTINVVLYAFCFATVLLSARGEPLAIPLAWVFAVAMMLNGVGHVGMMVIRGRYFPGGGTAFLLLAISVWLILRLPR